MPAVEDTIILKQIPGTEKENQAHKQKTTQYSDEFFVHGHLSHLFLTSKYITNHTINWFRPWCLIKETLLS